MFTTRFIIRYCMLKDMNIAVGSTNPVKIEAVRLAFEKVWPDITWNVSGLEVSSDISKQPMSDIESITGARNRANAVLHQNDTDYGVGIEGGIEKIGEHWFDCGWIVVIDKHGTEGIGSSLRLMVPRSMVQSIQAGKELGEVIDEVFGRTNAKQAEGHFGLMTNSVITRTSGYVDGIVAALARFIHPQLFTK